MGVLWSSLWGKSEPPLPPPPMVLVPPLFDYPPIAARTRMSVPAYEVMFGKLPRRCLFEDYFDQAGSMTSRIMLKPLEGPHVDLVANVSAAGDKDCGTEVKADALFRWQKELYDPHTFVELLASTSDPLLKLRSCSYYPEYHVGAFGTLPLLMGNSTTNNSLFQLAASWQANKNFMLKGKLGPSKSSVALAFKSWWRPSFTLSVTAVNDHTKGTTSYGFGIRVEDLRKASYEKADVNYVMLTPTKQHLAPAIMFKTGERPMFQADVDSGNFDHLPVEMRPIGNIL